MRVGKGEAGKGGKSGKKFHVGKSGKTLTAIGLPADINGHLPYITLAGTGYTEIEDHRGVLQLDDNCIRLLSPIGVIHIEGRDLKAKRMDSEKISIEGNVKSISFE